MRLRAVARRTRFKSRKGGRRRSHVNRKRLRRKGRVSRKTRKVNRKTRRGSKKQRKRRRRRSRNRHRGGDVTCPPGTFRSPSQSHCTCTFGVGQPGEGATAPTCVQCCEQLDARRKEGAPSGSYTGPADQTCTNIQDHPTCVGSKDTTTTGKQEGGNQIVQYGAGPVGWR